jgi:hypothetical protein
MKVFRLLSTAAACCALTAGLAAQAPPASPQTPATRPQQPPTTPAQAQSRTAPEITISGCLAQSEGASSGFTLTVIPPPAPTDAARTTTAAAAPTKPATYKIVGLGAAELKGHVNHHVELKGQPLPPAATADAVRSPSAMPQEFRASSVTMVSATCPPAK